MQSDIQRPLGVWCGLILGLAVSAGPVSAQSPGVQAGVSSDPGQVFVGLHLETRPILEQLRFRPGLDIGFGDDRALVAINLDLVYRIPLERSRWALQVGAGPAVNVIRNRDTDVEGGFNILLGVRHDRGLLTELRVGMMDSPDLKFAIGYTFR